ncbi:MAG: lysine--tRNA ligase [Gammaproteobacteria bacterium]
MSEEKIGGEAAIIHERKKKLEKLRSKGAGYINTFDRTHRAQILKKEYEQLSREQLEENAITGISVAGRIMLKRIMGNASFITISDEGIGFQIYVSKDALGQENYDEFKTWDIGDIVGAEGFLFRTKTDELTLNASSVTMITKSLKPLPEKHAGLTDIETRYRQRYLDLIVNAESKDVFIKRSLIIESVRATLVASKYLEVETPMMHPLPGGATARPFITHHNALDRDLFLRVAPELYLKRLLVGGFDRVFEINRNFRNEGLSTKHNPEFTMLEFYTAYSNLSETYKFIEKIIKQAAASIGQNQNQVEWDGDLIDLSEFKVISMSDLVKEHNNKFKSEVCRANVEELAIYAESIGIKNPKKLNYGQLLFEIFEETVESKLIQPTFVTEYPVEISPLSRRNDLNPDIADRFELFIGGKEIANGFCELNDAEDQAKRFAEQVEAGKAGDNEAMSFDQDYITALEVGMPPAVGVGIGIDRLAMFLTNQNSIRDVILFPQLKN